jgi:hypothetical protein
MGMTGAAIERRAWEPSVFLDQNFSWDFLFPSRGDFFAIG